MLLAQQVVGEAKSRTDYVPMRDVVQERFVREGGFPGGPRAPADRDGERTFVDLPWKKPGTDPRVKWVVWEPIRTLPDKQAAHPVLLEPTHAGIVQVDDAYLFSSNGLIRDGRGFQYALGQALYCWGTLARKQIMKGQKLREVVKERHDDLFSMVRLWDYAFSHAIIHAVPKIVYWTRWLKERPHVKVLYQSELQKWCMQQFSRFPDSRFVRFKSSIAANRMYLPLFINENHPSRIVHPGNIHRPLRLHNAKPFRVLYAIRGPGVRCRKATNDAAAVHVLMRWADKWGFEFSVFTATSPARDRDRVNQAVLLTGPHGGALANCAFLPASSVLMEMGGTLEQFKERPCFQQVCRGLKQNYCRVTGSDFGYNKGTFTIDMRSLRVRLRSVEQFLGLVR